MHKNSILFILLAPLLVFAGTNKEFSLTIIHTNDIHAHLLPITKYDSECSVKDDADGKCFGGVARLATAINSIFKNNKNVLLLDAGDQFQGTLFYSKYKGDEARQFLNELGFQATTLGNHEFDDGSENLSHYVKGLRLPVVDANVDVHKEPSLAGSIKPYSIIEVGGERIGITGCTTTGTVSMSNPGANIKFTNIKSAVSKEVSALQKQGINKIILICHEGYAQDQKLASKINGIDVIVGGHSHTYLANNSAAVGTYPTVVKAPNGNPVLIVQAAMYGKYLGKLDVTFDRNGVPIKWSGEPILLDASVKPDPKIAAEVQKLEEPLQAMKKEIVGHTDIALSANCRSGECNLGTLITNAMLDATTREGTTVAIINSGGIRSGIPAGNISLGNILETLPFGNTISTFGLRGKDLQEVLENGASRVGADSGSFPQTSGLRFKLDLKAPIDQRVTKIEVKQKNGNYLPLQPNDIYRIVTVNFLRQGGDGYKIFVNKAIDPNDNGQLLTDAVINYIKKNSPLQ